MSVFGGYARYYDLFYRDKDYGAESRFVAQRLQQYAPAARELLELGCGSGSHALELARMGYSITGVDRSEEMLRAAQRRIAASGDAGTRVRVAAGDARHCRLGQRYDAQPGTAYLIRPDQHIAARWRAFDAAAVAAAVNRATGRA